VDSSVTNIDYEQMAMRNNRTIKQRQFDKLPANTDNSYHKIIDDFATVAVSNTDGDVNPQSNPGESISNKHFPLQRLSSAGSASESLPSNAVKPSSVVELTSSPVLSCSV
jgi:hypothetical protein